MLIKGVRISLCIIFFIFIWQDGFAKNIIGGYLQIKNRNNVIADFKITLKLHIDVTKEPFSDNVVIVKMIKTVDGSVRDSFKLVRTSSQNVKYKQETCAGSVELNTLYATFETDVLVHPEHYVDPDGYYLEWTDCCRPANVANLKNSELYTTTLRTQCPPIVQANKEYFNSTPTISDLSQFYICKNEPFVHQLSASDINGDSLNYSVVIPMGHHSTSKLPLEFANGSGPLDVIAGRPSLNADPKTGLLTVFPKTVGYFAFGVLVEEYRNGRRISATIREYALHVIDCSPSELTDQNVYLNDAPVTSTTICKGNTLKFTAKANPDWRYQWMFNGKEIQGATANALEVSREGEYSFNVLQSGDCAKTVESEKVHVTEANASFKLEKHGSPTSCEQAGETVLVGPKDLHYAYNWYKNNTLLANKSNSLTVSEPGNYWAVVESSTCKLLSDTITIEQSSNPNVKVEMEPILPTCGNDNTPITLVGTPAGGIFQGAGVVNNVFLPKQAGIGVHELTYSISSTSPCPNAVAKQMVEVIDCIKLSIPDAFTPNQDGINDKWELSGIDNYPEAEVTIFNRWGNVIFHSKGYKEPFDGASNQAGVYHYKIKLNEVLPPKSGPLMLIR